MCTCKYIGFEEGSAQCDLSGGFSNSKNEPLLQSKCTCYSISGGQNSLSDHKRRLSGG